MARRSKFQAARSTEQRYQSQLTRVARVIGNIIQPYIEAGGTVPRLPQLMEALRAYGESLGPWATRVADEMLRSVAAQSRRAFKQENKRLTEGFREMMASSEVGLTQQVLLREQVTLIKSLPTKAGERVQTMATEAVMNGSRGAEIERELLRSGEVTEARARLIARTEVAKAQSTLTEARAKAAGSNAYIWRTAEDEAVRESHAEMEGQVVLWDSPPTLSDGTVTHAGQIYNCRCFAEPIFTDDETNPSE